MRHRTQDFASRAICYQCLANESAGCDAVAQAVPEGSENWRPGVCISGQTQDCFSLAQV